MEKRKRGRPRKQLTNAALGDKAGNDVTNGVSDGSTAKYYELPARAKELQDYGS